MAGTTQPTQATLAPATDVVYTNETAGTMRIQSINGKRLASPIALEPGESVTATIRVIGTYTMCIDWDETSG